VALMFSCRSIGELGNSRDNNKALNSNNAREVKKKSQNRVFDLLHTKLHLKIDLKNEKLQGEAFLKLKPYANNVKQLIIDAKFMDINSVGLVIGNQKKALRFQYDSLQLEISLDKTYNNEEEFLIYIDYTSIPERIKDQDRGLYFIKKKKKDAYAYQAWTQGETDGASCWFPTIDQPNERCTQEIYLTLPDSLVSLSNGKLVYKSNNQDGTRTDYWKQDLSHAPYLFMIAVGEFKIIKDQWGDKPVWYYIEDEFSDYALDIFGNTPEMLSFFSELLDFPYPWEKYSQIIVRDFVSGAMENTSATVFFDGMLMTDKELLDGNYEDIIAHELFHHWFGNLVTCESWSHIALNESFATYGEYLWFEYKYGKIKAQELMLRNKRHYFEDSELVQYPLVRHSYLTTDDVFDAHSYEKGAMILHFLRNYLGDDIFFTALKRYLKTHQFKSVETHELRLAFEEASGKDLNWFFDQWFFSHGHPIIDWHYEINNNEVLIYVEQSTSRTDVPLFNMPIDIKVQCIDTTYIDRLWMYTSDTVFNLKKSSEISFINLDPFRTIPGILNKPVNHQVINDHWQYLDHVEDRINYLDVAMNLKETDADIFYNSMLDSSKQVTLKALSYYNENVFELTEKAIVRLKTLLTKDKPSEVRLKAAKILLNTQNNRKEEFVNELAKDPSVIISNWALIKMSEYDTTKTLNIARQKQNSNTLSEVFCVSEVFSKLGSIHDAGFYIKAMDTYRSWKLGRIMSDMSNYISIIEDKKVVDLLLNKVLDLKTDYGIYMSYIMSSLKETILDKYKKWYKGDVFKRKSALLDEL